jgi:hypothetical protein
MACLLLEAFISALALQRALLVMFASLVAMICLPLPEVVPCSLLLVRVLRVAMFRSALAMALSLKAVIFLLPLVRPLPRTQAQLVSAGARPMWALVVLSPSVAALASKPVVCLWMAVSHLILSAVM